MIEQAPLWAKICAAMLPAIVTAIVGGFTVWLGSRQLRRTSELAEKQMQLSAKTATDQFGATLAAANMNYRAQVLSTNRQAWINSLRDDLATFIGKAENIGIHGDNYSEETSIKVCSELSVLTSRIKLRLNLNESLAKEVEEAVRQVYLASVTRPREGKDLIINKLKLETAAGQLFKAEWERVKRGE
jgi:hypothetical protein